MSPTEAALAPAQVQAYQRDGYTIVEGFCSEDAAAQAKEESKRLLGAERPKSGVRVLMPEDLSPPLLDVVCGEAVTAMLQQLLGPHVEFLSVKPVFKDGSTRFGTPWHQDWHYWHGSNKISLWIALDRATAENGALVFLPGTHRELFQNHQPESAESFPNRLDAADLEGRAGQTIAVEAGDAVFFHDQLVHGSHPNDTGAERWSLIATYRDASQRDDSETWRSARVLSGESVNV